ncbi:hypothetical protein [Cupriavidus sp. H39]|uniref:hypothetical protein n=1 Tax=Cupriavidus sp. H39 TaxID=3401635 RepID=UPI003D08B4CA
MRTAVLPILFAIGLVIGTTDAQASQSVSDQARFDGNIDRVASVDPYTDGARGVADPRDPYTDGARSVTEPRDPYTDGA